MKDIKVYTIDHCGYCEAAKALLKKNGLDFREINISFNDEERQKLIETTHHRTMPQIFIDGKFIGGYTELKDFLHK